MVGARVDSDGGCGAVSAHAIDAAAHGRADHRASGASVGARTPPQHVSVHRAPGTVVLAADRGPRARRGRRCSGGAARKCAHTASVAVRHTHTHASHTHHTVRAPRSAGRLRCRHPASRAQRAVAGLPSPLGLPRIGAEGAGGCERSAWRERWRGRRSVALHRRPCATASPVPITGVAKRGGRVSSSASDALDDCVRTPCRAHERPRRHLRRADSVGGGPEILRALQATATVALSKRTRKQSLRTARCRPLHSSSSSSGTQDTTHRYRLPTSSRPVPPLTARRPAHGGTTRSRQLATQTATVAAQSQASGISAREWTNRCPHAKRVGMAVSVRMRGRQCRRRREMVRLPATVRPTITPTVPPDRRIRRSIARRWCAC